MSRPASTPISPVTIQETLLYSRGMAALFIGLFFFYALTLEEPPCGLPLLLYGALSLGMIAGYLLITPRSIYFPRGEDAPLRIQYPLITLTWALGFFVLLHGQTPVYFYLAALDEYISLALFHNRRLATTWLTLLYVVIFAALLALHGWPHALSTLLKVTPTYLLMGGLGELVTRLWEARERAEALAASLEDANHRLRDYNRKAEALAVAQERSRLAHEIHDSLGHTLTALGMQLDLLQQLPANQLQVRQQTLIRARHLANTAQSDLWRAVQALHPPPLEMLSLPEAMRQLVAAFSRRVGRPVTWKQSGEMFPLPTAVSLTLYRCLQEGLTNVLRHAPQAQHITAHLHYQTDRVVLQVENDSPADSGETEASPPSHGFGLQSLQERVESLGGALYAAPLPDGGFLLEVCLPASLPLAAEEQQIEHQEAAPSPASQTNA
ncbi:MAG: sensor histidine kinase [Anaerolineae bacterium]|nr:MAG: sensor histidine kinase [Anaerolineae bacterium]